MLVYYREQESRECEADKVEGCRVRDAILPGWSVEAVLQVSGEGGERALEPVLA